MLAKIEHVALAVDDLDAAIAHYRNVWGLEVSDRERVEDEGIEEVMIPLGDCSLQLLGSIDEHGSVAKFLARRGAGLHHIAYQVDDLPATLAELKAKGVALIDEAPRAGGRGHQVAFVHPKDNHGLLVELVQAPRAGES